MSIYCVTRSLNCYFGKGFIIRYWLHSLNTVRLCTFSWLESSCLFRLDTQGRQTWGLGVATPRFLSRGLVGVAGESWGSLTGREIWLYLIKYSILLRKYVRKWWLLKRIRIICQEVAVNEQFLPRKSIYFFAWKHLNFLKICQIFSKICLAKSKFFKICLEKSKFSWPGSRPPRFQRISLHHLLNYRFLRTWAKSTYTLKDCFSWKRIIAFFLLTLRVSEWFVFNEIFGQFPFSVERWSQFLCLCFKFRLLSRSPNTTTWRPPLHLHRNFWHRIQSSRPVPTHFLREVGYHCLANK